MKHSIVRIFLIFFAIFLLSAQKFSHCYNAAIEHIAYSQRKSLEHKTDHIFAKQHIDKYNILIPKEAILKIKDATYVASNDLMFKVNGVSFKMIKVKGGIFTMGFNFDKGIPYNEDERTLHLVTLSDFWIGETEVTQALWKAVMGDNPSDFKGDNLPVEQVSWNDCQIFIKKLNALTGKSFRLPTEAEWEYAARGGCQSKGYMYSGSNSLDEVAWYSKTTDHNGTKPVKTKKPNELGLYDMSGNVCEWCSDYFGSYSSFEQNNPSGPSSGSSRVFRGGGWYHDVSNCRVSRRRHQSPDYRDFNGFRLVLI